MKADNAKSWMGWLLLSAAVTIVLWRLPWGNYLLYPFTILATWFHEMGHGLAALVLGGSLHQLILWPDGSGLALFSIGEDPGRIVSALTAAGGPLGPVVCGALFILSGRNARSASAALYLLGLALALSVVLWVRPLFGIVAISGWAVAILLLAFRAPDWAREFGIQFLGVQACVSAYRSLGYLFTQRAKVGGKMMTTDTYSMQDALLLPHWFWALAIVAVSAGILILALRTACKPAP